MLLDSFPTHSDFFIVEFSNAKVTIKNGKKDEIYTETRRKEQLIGLYVDNDKVFCIFNFNESTHARENSKFFWFSAHLIVPLHPVYKRL